MVWAFRVLVLAGAVAGIAPLGLAGSAAAPDEVSLRSRLAELAFDEPPCATASVQADEVILPATWCLALTGPGADPEEYAGRHTRDLHWIAVQQPREIHAILLENELIPDPRKGRNLEELAWLGEMEWWLASEFYWPEGRSTDNQTLVLESLHGATGAWLNGRPIELAGGEFAGRRADLSDRLSPKDRNRLVLRITPSKGQRISAPNPEGPALFRCGLEGAARIVAERDMRIEAVASRITLASDCTSGTVDLEIRVRKRSPGTVRAFTHARLRLPDRPGRVPLFLPAAQSESIRQGENLFRLSLEIDDPRLWWPVGAGDPYLYPVQVSIRQPPSAILTDRRIQIGFRTIEWRDGGTLVINRQPLPVKATAWTPIDPSHPERAQALGHPIGSIMGANLNALWVRTPGGLESERFYDACDQAGVLILQEIPALCSGVNQDSVMNLETHASMAAWTGGRDSFDSLGALSHERPILPVSPYGEGPGLALVEMPAAPHPQTWEEFLAPDERWPVPSLWQPGQVTAGRLAARIPEWGDAKDYIDYSLITQSIQAAFYQEAIERTRIAAPNSGVLITGRLRAPWPGLWPALLDVLDRPSMAFWAVRRSWEPSILSLRRTEQRFEAWIANAGLRPVTGALTVFDALQPAGDRRSIASVSVPSGTAALVWSSTRESWAEQAFREGDLRVLGAFVGEPISTVGLAQMAMPILRTPDGKRIPSLRPQPERDPRVPPSHQAALMCAAPAQIALPTAELHIVTFAEDHGPWRVTIRSFGRTYLRQVRLAFDPPDSAWASDQFFDVVPDSGRLVTITSLDPKRDRVRVTLSAANAAPVSFLLFAE